MPIIAQGDLQDMGVDRDNVQLVQGEQGDAVGDLSPHTDELDQLGTNILGRPGPKAVQEPSATFLGEDPCRLSNELGSIPKPKRFQLIDGYIGQYVDRREPAVLDAIDNGDWIAVLITQPVQHGRDPGDVVVRRTDEREQALDWILSQQTNARESCREAFQAGIGPRPDTEQRSNVDRGAKKVMQDTPSSGCGLFTTFAF